MESTAEEALTKREVSRLSKLETTIQKGMQTFFEVGAALKEIRDNKLYRAEFERFEDYCQERWGFTHQHALNFVRATETRSNLETIVSVLPANEAQCRPLTKLAPGDQQSAWQEVIERAAEESENERPAITAKLVQEVVREYTGDPPPRQTTVAEPRLTADIVFDLLEHIEDELQQIPDELRHDLWGQIVSQVETKGVLSCQQ